VFKGAVDQDQKIAASFLSTAPTGMGSGMVNVGAAEGCDLLIFGVFKDAVDQGQKIAASFHSTAPTPCAML